MTRYGLLLLLLLLSPWGAWAQDGIHRCVGADGNPVFTDQPCAALQATPVASTPAPASTAAMSVAPAAALASPPPVLCASSVAALRQSMVDAFATRDPNRLAGLMIWNGYGREAVVSDIRSLGALMQRPLLDIGEADEDEPAATSSAGPPRTNGDTQLVVRTASDDGSGVPRETRFSVVRRSGCLWLRGSG
ncbi:DUF4124 domain-containing protein [Dyella sp. C9]|uniref:DUF4124 domain-containing protein n=1 Tax=Dyella sp. C9 TaxID=2202154 RepID=UPI000DEF85E2|nr:DUF4124 domain-containing protein [Dyella sp. C9]